MIIIENFREGNVYIFFKDNEKKIDKVLADTFKEYLKERKINNKRVEKSYNRR